MMDVGAGRGEVVPILRVERRSGIPRRAAGAMSRAKHAASMSLSGVGPGMDNPHPTPPVLHHLRRYIA